jgi:hypothetical protein
MNSNADPQRRVRQRSTLDGLYALVRRLARSCVVLVFLTSGGVASFVQLPPEVRAPRILVGPNVLVSREPSVAHVEPWVAAHPTDPSKLIAMATTRRDVDGGYGAGGLSAALYASSDGGHSWTGPVRPHPAEVGGQDPIVGYGLRGTAYAVSLVGGPSATMWVYRSEDGGLNWDAGVKTRQADHQRMAVDLGTGKYAGRAYLAAEGREDPATRADSGRAAYVWRSNDDGRTWLPPVVAGKNQDARIRFHVVALQVLSDGTVALFMLRRPPPGDGVIPTQDILLSTSTDGGVTFSGAREIGKVHFGGRDEVGRRQAAARFDADATLSFDGAVDTHNTRYRDRMYIVHAESRAGTVGNRLVLSYSTDRGVTWSAPKDVAPETDPEAGQFHSAIAVNLDGAVGVFWYDTRELVGRDQWHVYFSASLDGGDTFLAPVRVSSEPSTPFTAENHRPILANSVLQSPNGVSLSMRSAFARFPNGGDYVGLTADAAGVFHPFWTDARTGSFQLYTSRIQVVRESGRNEPSRGAAESTRAQVLNEKVTLALDPTRLDLTAGEILVPVRLKNTSAETLYGPFTVEIVRLEAPVWSSAGDGRDRSAVVELLNSSNGLTGKGARIDYTRALRDLPALLPGAVSEAITWRVRPPSLRKTEGLDIEVVITGHVGAKPGKGTP